ncbi:MAG: endonuclease/exonuclease/phosphatase family metal-dependent hydrolase [Phycisphaerales bacterium]|jgi:endonuclease/exonuclease/phosphatase family metal-dependent hydrolase
MIPRTILAVLALVFATVPAHAQWDPANGSWLKSDAADLRVMTWNVQDGVCSTAIKTNSQNSWNALVRVVAAIQPDVLILQEAGDNSGNGTGSGVDSINALKAVCNLFLHGGADPFLGGSVGSYVQAFIPAYDLPYIYVSRNTDGYNRNVVLSRYPAADLNGDGIAVHDDFNLSSDAYQSGGNGGIRGFAFIEIDLPDETYAGDAVVGNSHLKAGGNFSDYDDREAAAQNIAYLIHYNLNGNGTGSSDPNGRISTPSPTTILDANTPMIWGGDWNQTPSSTAPDAWMTQAATVGGTDGTDRDGTDASRDFASHPITGDSSTQSSSKLDYIAYQDSIATSRREFIFRTTGTGLTSSNFPAVITSSPRGWAAVSGNASDHRPVIVDLILPAPAAPCPADITGDGVVDNGDIGAFVTLFLAGDSSADLTGDGVVDNGDIGAFVTAFLIGC